MADHKASISWDQAKDTILWGLENESAIEILQELVMLKRTDKLHQSLKSWILSVKALVAKLTTMEVTIPDDVATKYVTRQMTKSEKQRFSNSQLSSVDSLLRAVEDMGPTAMPVHREKFNKLELPSRTKASSKEATTSSNVDRKTKTKDKNPPSTLTI